MMFFLIIFFYFILFLFLSFSLSIAMFLTIEVLCPNVNSEEENATKNVRLRFFLVGDVEAGKFSWSLASSKTKNKN